MAVLLINPNRMKPDDVLKACAAKGGVIVIEAASHTMLTEKHPEHSLDSYMEHFEYVATLVEIERVAFGPDTLVGDHVEGLDGDSFDHGPLLSPSPHPRASRLARS